MKDKEIFSKEWCNLVFEDRNRAYGAYELRRTIGRRYARSLEIVFLLLFLFMGALGVNAYLRYKALKDAFGEIQELVNQDKLRPLEGHEFKRLAQGRRAVPHMKPNASMSKPEIADQSTEIKEFGINGPETKEEAPKTLVVDQDSLHNHDQLDLPVEGAHLTATDVVEEMPRFPGGIGALMKWLDSRIEYRPGFIRDKIEGTMEVTFIVKEDGTTENIHVTHSLDPSIDRMVIAILKEMPQWEAGKSGGRMTAVQIKLPIEFRL